MRVLITGSRGFVGKATAELLEQLGHNVIHFDLLDGYDIRNREQLHHAAEEYTPDRILHLAAVARFAEADDDPLKALSTNVDGSWMVAQVASGHGIPLVYASTGSVYMPVTQEPPITEDFPVAGNSVYGCTKLMGELFVRQSAFPWMILRYAHLYGAEKRLSGLVANFIDRIERGLAPTLYGGQQSNDFTYIKDVARANVKALAAELNPQNWNQVYNIGTGEELTTDQAAMAIRDAWSYDGPITIMPQRVVDAQRFVYDVSKAKERLRFMAHYSFTDGLADMSPVA